MAKLTPLLLKPKTKDYIWGGTKLASKWGKIADTAKIAESWELSLYPDMECEIASGPYAGLTLDELNEAFPGIFGEFSDDFSQFPILIKLIDATENLSIQVHPSDEYAKLNERGQLGKTEMWYIADAEPTASIYLGFSENVAIDDFKKAITQNTVTKLLNQIKVKAGDCFFIPAGTVHAILKGVTVYEVQENSNLTYRVYDYNRTDSSGKPRELHIEKALQVSNLSKTDTQFTINSETEHDGYKSKLLAKCDYFEACEITSTAQFSTLNKDSFVCMTVLSGAPTFGNTTLKKGDTVFIPAGINGVFTGEFTAIATCVPSK